ncbi:aldehyde dehydrogenase family protein [Amycolatopsis pithecellobii]|uniref:Aldehyde dehydrogenase family protein n=1 Tax=Amycolatopsis pithecellobii TaxID=664692 RepID=A0A6N7Z787_9PSEU|nr:aldehyde dehydrogenase family protein [Amycolatopsis pithecellobii]MTD56880.1 aldehyde dehydrogenase family protein [Amycolatopsis pithecellobii]
MSTEPARLDALGVRGPLRTVRTADVSDVDGSVLARLSVAPALSVKQNLKALRRAQPLPRAGRIAALAAAGELFTGTVDGVTLDEHERLVCRASGVALPVVRAASRAIANSAACAGDAVEKARPVSSAQDWRNVRDEGAVWVRRAEVLAVLAPGNHPGTHTPWLEALALGYRVAVRPSQREPFTPHRLVSALRASGFGDDQVVLLPTDHATAGTLADAADLALVYGGDDIVAKYDTRGDVLVQGPGRSKILLTADDDWRDHVDTIVDSVCGFGGTACVNASAVFVEGDAAAVAQELARRLGEIPVRPPLDEAAVLPAFPLDRAKAIEARLNSELPHAQLISGEDLVVELEGGGAVLRPAVALLDRATAPQARIELPFPCVWVVPWSRSDGTGPLRNTLTLTAFTTDPGLLTELAGDGSISNLHIGDHPTHHMRPGLPHDGHLAEFLMKSKSVLR